MVKQHQIPVPPGAHTRRRRYGRGDGSGRGSYSGKGRKGQKSRTGRGHMRPGFEGNQLPFILRVPSLGGFRNPFATVYAIVNLKQLDQRGEPGIELTPAWMVQVGLIRKSAALVKVLGEGEVTKPLMVSAHRFSQSAQQKLLAAGGAAHQLPMTKSKKGG